LKTEALCNYDPDFGFSISTNLVNIVSNLLMLSVSAEGRQFAPIAGCFQDDSIALWLEARLLRFRSVILVWRRSEIAEEGAVNAREAQMIGGAAVAGEAPARLSR
jgi:hypothetical protein